MSRRLISSGSSFEQTMGYSRAVVDGEWLFLSGTTGFNYASMTISDDPAAQAEQAFQNIKNVLEGAGFSLADIVRVVYYVPRAEDFDACVPVMGKYLNDVRPAATAVNAALVDKRIKIEIEVTAKKPG
jgi:enamine deaminase RidA (YjgF/YER057c/UK114 family)